MFTLSACGRRVFFYVVRVRSVIDVSLCICLASLLSVVCMWIYDDGNLCRVSHLFV
jgi:hypothetical protein